MTTKPLKGGFMRPLSLSLFIRDYLMQHGESWGFDVYQAYKEEAQGIPLARGKGKRKVISASGFRNYMWVMRHLGLIEYVTNPDGTTKTAPAVDKSGAPAPHLADAIYIRIILGREGDSAWTNIWKAYRGVS